MAWFGQRTERAPDPAPEPVAAAPPGEEGAAPGLSALFDGLAEDGSLNVLDLGPATPATFGLYGPFARRVRYLDLLGGEFGGQTTTGQPHDRAAPAPVPTASRLAERARTPGSGPGIGPDADLILAWDTLDWSPPDARVELVQALVARAKPGARIHLVTRALSEAPRNRLAFTPLGEGRIRIESVPGPRLQHAFLQPAEVSRLLDPFVVRRGFVLKSGLREYVAGLPADRG
jgi:hypothetical protein